MITKTNIPNWPEGTIEVEHNNVTLYIVPTVDGIEVDSINDFYLRWNNTDEQLEITFMDITDK